MAVTKNEVRQYQSPEVQLSRAAVYIDNVLKTLWKEGKSVQIYFKLIDRSADINTKEIAVLITNLYLGEWEVKCWGDKYLFSQDVELYFVFS